jgi:hypothetical protein
MKKDQYLNILNYLLEFSKIRSVSVKDILADKTRYEEVIWFNEIENNSFFSNIIFESNQDNKICLTIKQPSEKEPVEPELTADLELNAGGRQAPRDYNEFIDRVYEKIEERKK